MMHMMYDVVYNISQYFLILKVIKWYKQSQSYNG